MKTSDALINYKKRYPNAEIIIRISEDPVVSYIDDCSITLDKFIYSDIEDKFIFESEDMLENVDSFIDEDEFNELFKFGGDGEEETEYIEKQWRGLPWKKCIVITV